MDILEHEVFSQLLQNKYVCSETWHLEMCSTYELADVLWHQHLKIRQAFIAA